MRRYVHLLAVSLVTVLPPLAPLMGQAIRSSHPKDGRLGAAPDYVHHAKISAQVEDILSRMTLAEKLSYIGGSRAWNIKPMPQFGLPEIYATDASLGVRLSHPVGVGYPSGMALAATWNIAIAKSYGTAIANDARTGGFQNILGPGMDLYRLPLNARAFEYISGEDPYLGAVLAPATINAIQAQGIWATAKHWAANDQEENRFHLNEIIDERTLREMSLVPFESAVKNSNPANVMCGFNEVNGDYDCESKHLNLDILKGEWRFKGFLESDYDAIHNGLKGAEAGTDIDMPSGYQMNADNLQAAIDDGSLQVPVIDDKVRRILTQIFLFGFQKGDVAPSLETEIDDPASELASLNTAREGMVLLRNEHGLLPLRPGAERRIAVIGQRAKGQPPTGGGSTYIAYNHYTSELAGIQAAAGPDTTVDFIDGMSLDPSKTKSVSGFQATYYNSNDLSGTPALVRNDALINFDWHVNAPPVTNGDGVSVNWSGTVIPTVTGDHIFQVRADGSVKIYVNNQLIADNGNGHPITPSIPPTIPVNGKIHLIAGQPVQVDIVYQREAGYFSFLGNFTGVQFSWASLQPSNSLANYDAVVVVAGLGSEYEGEGFDRPFDMPEYQDELISNVSAVNSRTIAVINAGGGVDMSSFTNKVGGLIFAWYPGQNGGQALGELLYGKVNPSGKLPISIERKITDNPAYATYALPQNSLAGTTTIKYAEGVFGGYRGYERNKIKPLFPFGYGLSYTTFKYDDLKLLPTRESTDGSIYDVKFTITNSGQRAGYEVAEVYVGEKDPLVARPIKELKGFAKVYLEAGETKTVSIPLNLRAFAYYDVTRLGWTVDRADYTVSVGKSSADILLSKDVKFQVGAFLSSTTSRPVIRSKENPTRAAEDGQKDQ